jgi:hypothetical protein
MRALLPLVYLVAHLWPGFDVYIDDAPFMDVASFKWTHVPVYEGAELDWVVEQRQPAVLRDTVASRWPAHVKWDVKHIVAEVMLVPLSRAVPLPLCAVPMVWRCFSDPVAPVPPCPVMPGCVLAR